LPSMIRIAIFDDHRERREALKLLISLQEGMLCAGDYDDCSDLVDNLRSHPVDVVLMDIDMPGIGGIDGVKLLRRYYPKVYVIMQTVFEEDDKIFNCLLAGAHGYLLKKAPNGKIVEAIREVVEGGAPMSPSIARRVLNHFSDKSTRPKEEEYNLSKREAGILSLLVKGYSHKMAAAELNLSIFTINNHVKSIYQKLHVHSVSEAVASAIRNNIV
jgi:DNA-binding NarL/FixJ family response regulator